MESSSSTAGDEEYEENGYGDFVLKELLPLVSGEAELSEQQLLDLSANYGASNEQRIVTSQQRSQVKKSRRGPRSRSCQYRGVTSYGRTG